MADLDIPRDLGHDLLLSGHFRFRLQDRLRHLQDRPDRGHGDRDTRQGGKCAHDIAIGDIESDILVVAHPGPDRQVVQDNRAAQRDRQGQQGVQLDKSRRIVFQRSVPGIEAPPAGEHALFRSGQPDFLDPVQDRKAHALFLRGQLHLLPGDPHLHDGCRDADRHRGDDDQDRRYHQSGREPHDICDIKK